MQNKVQQIISNDDSNKNSNGSNRFNGHIKSVYDLFIHSKRIECQSE